MKCSINSLYVCVKDMDRAVAFYERLFGQQVTVRDGLYSVFDVGGFRFGLFAFEKAGEPHTYGSNCLPSIEFDSLETLGYALCGQEICFPLTVIGDNHVAEIVDSEGNRIELTAKRKDFGNG